MIDKSTASTTAFEYLLEYLEVKPEHQHFFELLDAVVFANDDCMVNIGLLGIIGKYWTVFIDCHSGKVVDEVIFTTDRTDLDQQHNYPHLPDYLNKLLDRYTLSTLE